MKISLKNGITKDTLKKIIIPFIIMIIFNLGSYYFMLGRNFGEGFTPHVGLFVISGILFGPYGALGTALGNAVCDLIRGYNVPCTISSEIVGFFISYFAYKLWYEQHNSRTLVKPRLNNTSNVILFLFIVILCATLFALMNKKLFYIFNPETASINFVIGVRYFINFINSAFIFGIIGIWISKKFDFVPVPKLSKRKINKKFYEAVAIALFLAIAAIIVMDYFVDNNPILIIIELQILTILIVLYSTKPITKEITDITYYSIPEKVMDIFLLAILFIVIFGTLMSFDSVLVKTIDEILIGFYDVPLAILILVDILLIIFFIPAITVLRYVERKVVHPITSFSEIEKYIKKGDKIESEQLIDVYSNYLNEDDEIGMLARSYTDLINYGNEYIENLHIIGREKERIKTELEIAEGIQKSNLPIGSIENKDYTVYGFSKPAKEVGGDFYDYYPINEDNIAIIIGDASGKGIPAALLSTITQSIIKQILESEKDPSKVLYLLNNQLCENNFEAMFITLWLGIYNNKTKILTFANAGHNPPLIMENGKFRPLEVNTAIVLGIMEDFEFIKEDIHISEGIIAYTDGITDAMNSNNEFYGEERLINFLNTHPFENKVINKLLADIDEFTGSEPQFDDMTLVLLDRHDLD